MCFRIVVLLVWVGSDSVCLIG